MNQDNYLHRIQSYNAIIENGMRLQRELAEMHVPEEHLMDCIYGDIAAKTVILRGSLEAAKESLPDDQLKIIQDMVDFVLAVNVAGGTRALILKEIYGEEEQTH